MFKVKRGREVLKKIITIILSVALALSLIGNILQFTARKTNKSEKPLTNIMFSNANSRDTYFTIHNIAEAHKENKGKGIKVGVIDWNFGSQDNKNLYYDVKDFTGYSNNFGDGHGKWMATVLKEIAPECEIYALATGLDTYEEGEFTNVLIEAIDWSIDNKLDILTLSVAKLSDENIAKLDVAVDRAIEQGIVTTFIHYENPNNILPFGLLEYDDNSISYSRLPDINIFHYDYNTLFIDQYLEYLTNEPPKTYGDIKNGGYIPFISFSSMSPVTAGFVAILKSENNTLSPAEYKKILIETSYSKNFRGIADFENVEVDHVVDIGSALKYLKDNYR